MDLISVAARKAAGRDFEARPSDLNKDLLDAIAREIIGDINRQHERDQREKSAHAIRDAVQDIDIEQAAASKEAYQKELAGLLGQIRKAQSLDAGEGASVPKALKAEINGIEGDMASASGGLVFVAVLLICAFFLALGSTSFILGGFWWTVTVVLAGWGALAAWGLYLKGEPKRICDRARECANFIGSGVCCTVDDLARYLGKSMSKTKGVLDSALALGIFPHGCFDSEGVAFFLNRESKEEYERRLSVHLMRLENLTQALSDGIYSDELGDVDLGQSPVVAKGRRYARRIGKLGRGLSKSEVSHSIEQIAAEVTCIYAYVGKHPESESKIVRVTDYMLPTTLKILGAYAEMDALGVDTPSVMQTRKQIEEALEMLVGTYDKVLDRLYSSLALDISSDIAVLEMLGV